MNRSALIENLAAEGKPLEPWESPDGTRVLVLPYGGRVLGLFAPDDETNFFWTHPALGDVDTSRQLYQSEEWHNSGGERTWLAPEVDFFFPDFPDLNRYWQQRELDPGDYKVSHTSDGLTWTSRATLAMSRTKLEVAVEIAKSLQPALNPLRSDTRKTDAEVKYAGYTLRTSLQVASLAAPVQIGLWNLLQMPHGGTMLVPTLSRCAPKVYFGSIGPEDLTLGSHLLRYTMRAEGGHKIGIDATELTGRAGYLYGSEDEVSLVIRNFYVDPSGEYVDVPWTQTDNFGCVFQACNVKTDVVAFSELEYHAPAIGASPGNLHSEDESQLWAFRGPWPSIRSVARRLLSDEIGEEATFLN